MAFESNAYAHSNVGFNADASPLSGDILSGLAVSAGGNVAGALANGGLNYLLQENQFEHQKQLQDRAARRNAQAVAEQAQLQKLGMENAGLSPAPVQGTGAPSLQAGAAAGASSQMANIFSGLAELVQAIKAPTEIEKSVAESRLAGAEATKIGTDIEQYRDYNDFMQKHGPSMFEEKKAALEQAIVREWTDDDGVKHTESLWDFLDDKTRSTWQKIIDGEIPFTVGRFKAMMDDVEAQVKFAEADDRQVTSMAHLGILLEKLQDPKALQALLDKEKNEVRQLEQGIKESKSRAYANWQQGKLAGAEATRTERETPDKDQSEELLKARVELMQTQVAEKIQQMDQKALSDWKYLYDQGRYADCARAIFGNASQEAVEVVKAVGPWAVAGRAAQLLKMGSKPQTPVAPHSTKEGGNAMSIQEFMRQSGPINDPSKLKDFW